MPGYRCGSPSSNATGGENNSHSRAKAGTPAPPADEVQDQRPPFRRVIRATTPPRSGTEEEQRQVLWMVFSEGRCVRADLVALTDAIELEIFAGTTLRRVL